MNFRFARFHAADSKRCSPKILDRQSASSLHHLNMNLWYRALSFLNTNGPP